MNSQIHALSCLSRFVLRRLYSTSLLAACVAFVLPQAWASAAQTTTSLAITSSGSDVSSVNAGTVVTLTATVLSGSTPVNPGQVRFCDATAAHCEDSALLATAQLTSAGIATYKFRPGIGSHSYKAVFVGTNNFAKSPSTTAALTVTLAEKYSTTTTIAASGSVGDYALMGTVTGPGNRTFSPAGNVSFLDTTNGNALLGVGALGTAVPANSFSVLPSFGGADGFSSAVGDFNGDGIPDLVIGSPINSLGMSVSLGNGDGTFNPGTPISAIGSNAIAIGDFNSDGNLDLVVADYLSNTITVLLGNGDGTFTTKTTVAVGNGPESIAVGDFNGDGVLDLAVVNCYDYCNYGSSEGGSVTILQGNGDGGFTTKSTVSLGLGSDAIAAADFNRDGIVDLVTANAIEGTLSVLLGNGDGTFTTKSTPFVGAQPTSIVVGDFNGDGIPDIAVGCYTEPVVLAGKGDGTFTSAFSIVINGPYAIAGGDFNDDGIQDLAIISLYDDVKTLTTLYGGKSGILTTTQSAGQDLIPESMAMGDFNGDGAADLVFSGYGITSVLTNSITETATVDLDNVSVSGSETHQVIASYSGDVNYQGGSSASTPLLAAKKSPTVSLVSSANPSLVGNPVTMTATLAPYNLGTITTDGETITFYNGSTVAGTGVLSSGAASATLKNLPLGSNTVTAAYGGDGNFGAVTSNSVGQMVENMVPLPTFNPASGVYAGSQMVTITDTVPGAIIYYTTNVYLPFSSWAVYDGPILVSNNARVYSSSWRLPIISRRRWKFSVTPLKTPSPSSAHHPVRIPTRNL